MSITTLTDKQIARRETNHRYYTKNSKKWQNYYRPSKASQVGTGALGEHRNPNFKEELRAVEKEMIYLRLRKRYTTTPPGWGEIS